MKKFISALAAGSLAVTFVATAFAQSSSSAMSSSSQASMPALSSSSSSQWKFVVPKMGGNRCEELSGVARQRCTSGKMTDALKRIKATMANQPLPAKAMMQTEKKVMKIETRTMEGVSKFRIRALKEAQRLRQRNPADVRFQSILKPYVPMLSSSSSSKAGSASSASSATSSSSSY